MAKKLTIIVPAFNEQDCVGPFVEEVERVFGLVNDTDSANDPNDAASNVDNNPPEYNILFVDDGSSDKTLTHISRLAQNHKNIKYISFSRNFGKEAAIYAGLEQAYQTLNSDYYVLMDADLQDPPAILPEMFTYLEENKDTDRVGSRRTTRKGEPAIRSFFARCFYRLMNKFSQVELVDGARDYQMMTARYVRAILDCGEYNRFFKGLSQWVGFKTHWLEYENIERTKGETKWSFWGLLGYSLEGIVAYSTWPLRLISIIGLVLSFVSVVMLIVVFVRALIIGDPVAGWPSLACVILLLGGIVLTCFGILGLYFEKTYLEVKKRPIYILKDDNLS